MVTPGPGADLLVTGAKLVATCDAERRELAGGWVAVTGGLISAVGGAADPRPAARETLDASGCLVTPGLVNTHHHMYQNLTRSYAPTVNGTLFEWLSGLYPLWAGLDEEAAYLSAWVALAELALGGCTTSTDHLYVAPAGGGDLWSAEIAAAREVGLRFHPTRGSMTISAKDGGLPPDSVVQDDDEVLADCERLVTAHHDPAWGAMVRVALAPCSPFSVSPDLMLRTAELAERLDVRLHTHLAEDPDEDTYCLDRFGRRPVEQYEEVGWLTSRSWVAHCVYPNGAEAARLGAAGVGVAHCPSSNMLLAGGGFAPVRELRAAGSPVGLGCDGSSSSDTSSLWLEARAALTLGRQRLGPAGMTAREVLDIGTRGGAGCLGRDGEIGQLSVGAAADLVCWPQEGVSFAGALTDPVEAWLRCGPTAARYTVVAGTITRPATMVYRAAVGPQRSHASTGSVSAPANETPSCGRRARRSGRAPDTSWPISPSLPRHPAPPRVPMSSTSRAVMPAGPSREGRAAPGPPGRSEEGVRGGGPVAAKPTRFRPPATPAPVRNPAGRVRAGAVRHPDTRRAEPGRLRRSGRRSAPPRTARSASRPLRTAGPAGGRTGSRCPRPGPRPGVVQPYASRRSASSAVRSMRSGLTLDGEHGASATRTMAPHAGSWCAVTRRSQSARTSSSSSAADQEAAGRTWPRSSWSGSGGTAGPPRARRRSPPTRSRRCSRPGHFGRATQADRYAASSSRPAHSGYRPDSHSNRCVTVGASTW